MVSLTCEKFSRIAEYWLAKFSDGSCGGWAGRPKCLVWFSFNNTCVKNLKKRRQVVLCPVHYRHTAHFSSSKHLFLNIFLHFFPSYVAIECLCFSKGCRIRLHEEITKPGAENGVNRKDEVRGFCVRVLDVCVEWQERWTLLYPQEIGTSSEVHPSFFSFSLPVRLCPLKWVSFWPSVTALRNNWILKSPSYLCYILNRKD